jgi:hypothetical protein
LISREAANDNIFIVFDLIQIGIKTRIYHIQDEHANHYTIDACSLCGWFMVFNSTSNNISAKLYLSVLLVEETVVPGEDHLPAVSH